MEQHKINSVGNFQRFLADLYSDEQLRNTFFQDRGKVIRRLDVLNAEKEMLLQLVEEEVERYVKTLLTKRYLILIKLLPDLERVIPKQDLDHYFEQYVAFSPLSLSEKHKSDLLGFLRFLMTHQAEYNTLFKDWIKNIKREQNKGVIISKLTYDLEDLWDYDTLQKKPHLLFEIRIGTMKFQKKLFL